MKCPRCGNEGDVRNRPCPYCGLYIAWPAQRRDMHDNSAPAGAHMSSAPLPTLHVEQIRRPTTGPLASGPLPSSGPGMEGAEHNGTGTRRITSPLRPRRLTTLPLPAQELTQTTPPPIAPAENIALPLASVPLLPGTFLRGERYCLQQILSRQEWGGGTSETIWIAQDAQRARAQVHLCELVLAESSLLTVQALLRNATIALTSIGRHPRAPMLWDVFSERQRHFFVFEPIDGESLQAQMQRDSRSFTEQEVLECCLQMVELLGVCAQQSPPLVHGLLCPEHLIKRAGGAYMPIHFSVVLAGQAPQFIAGVDRSQLSPYAAPDFVQHPADVRNDLYALLATAYYLLTGVLPVAGEHVQSIRPARSLNRALSLELNAVLEKGLRSAVDERYQSAEELQQALRSLVAEPLDRAQSNPRLSSVSVVSPLHTEQRSFPQTLVSIAQMSPALSPASTLANPPRVPQRQPTPPESLDTLAIEKSERRRFWLYWLLTAVLLITVLWLLIRLMNGS